MPYFLSTWLGKNILLQEPSSLFLPSLVDIIFQETAFFQEMCRIMQTKALFNYLQKTH